MYSFDVNEFRQHFPILSRQVNQQPLVYFDNGATMQKPIEVIVAESEYYQQNNANVHRSSHALSSSATADFERSRQQVKQFINAHDSAEVIWTKGTTESINLVAHAWGRLNIKAGDEIVLTVAEHHANIVPWQILAQEQGAVIKVITLDKNGYFDKQSIGSVITSKTKIVCFSHASNVLGKINPITSIIEKAKSVGAVTLVDGAQVISNEKVDVQALDCDFYVFSAHKMFGPTGVGVLYGKKSLLNKMKPYQAGGEMIKKVSFSGTTFNQLPFKFEAGTPNIAGVIAFSHALAFIKRYQLNDGLSYKQCLIDHCYSELIKIEQLTFIVEGKPELPIFSFIVNAEHHQDLASELNAAGIAVRSGHHCAMPLFEYLQFDGCIRLSLAAYNTLEEIDFVINCLRKVLDSAVTTNKQERAEQQLVGQGIIEQGLAKQDNNDASASMLAVFAKLNGWDSKHREIMMLGKNFVRMAKNKRNNTTLVTGCESDAWLEVNWLNNGLVQISADSDAKIIRGLMAIVLAAYNNKTVEQIIGFDINGYFEQLGLKQHLSPSRGNGLLAIVESILSQVKPEN